MYIHLLLDQIPKQKKKLKLGFGCSSFAQLKMGGGSTLDRTATDPPIHLLSTGAPATPFK
jgi:hypothetical protein